MSILRNLLRRCYIQYGSFRSITAKTDRYSIVISCFNGGNYSCNPKYIVDALENNFPGKFKFYLLKKDFDNSTPGYVEQVRYRSMKAIHVLTSSKVWISNRRTEWLIPKRENQVYIQTWHGFPLKRIEKDAESTLPVEYIDSAKRDGAITDLMFSDSKFLAEIYKNKFYYDGPVIKCGIPRNRPLVNPSAKICKRVYRYFGVADDKRICLYAPTFRGSNTASFPEFDVKSCLESLEKRFGGDYIFVYRLHPNISKYDNGRIFEGGISASNYPDTQELLATADVLITDYSSVAGDFILTGRPGFMYQWDRDVYENEDRGFYYDPKVFPYPISNCFEDLLKSIDEFDEVAFDINTEEFFKVFEMEDDGTGDIDIAKLINTICVTNSSVEDAAKKCSLSLW